MAKVKNALEENGKLRGAAFDKGRQLRPELIAESLELQMEEKMTEKFKEVEDYEFQCRERLETEMERHIAKCRKQYEAMLQETRNGKLANSLVDSQSLINST